MGLDMYLTKEIFIGANYEHRGVHGTINLKMHNPNDPNKPLKIKINKKKVTSITESVGYWRKANQIHKWFVDNIQGGEDNCQKSWVPYKKLVELRDLCKKVLKTKNASLLPPQSGFFFGNTEIDDYYWEDLRDTVKILNKLDPDGDYYYQASW